MSMLMSNKQARFAESILVKSGVKKDQAMKVLNAMGFTLAELGDPISAVGSLLVSQDKANQIKLLGFAPTPDQVKATGLVVETKIAFAKV